MLSRKSLVATAGRAPATAAQGTISSTAASAVRATAFRARRSEARGVGFLILGLRMHAT
jgi:hypothetical protein